MKTARDYSHLCVKLNRPITSEDINKDTEEFLKNGGKIEQVPMGLSKYSVEYVTKLTKHGQKVTVRV